MTKMKSDQRVTEFPDNLRDLIRRDTDEGLARFRRRDFEASLKRRLGPAPKSPRHHFFIFQRAPFLAMIFMAAVIGAVVLWLDRGSPQSSAGALVDAASLMVILQDTPGLANLGEFPLLPPRDAVPNSTAASLIAGRLSSAIQAAVPAPPAVSAPAPRTSLEQKMEILDRDRAIERALAPFQDKFKED